MKTHYNTLKARFSATVGEEPEIEVALNEETYLSQIHRPVLLWEPEAKDDK